MTIGLLDEWVVEDTQTSRRKAEILERFVASSEPMVGSLTQSQAADILRNASQAALAMGTRAPGIWHFFVTNLTGMNREEVGKCVSTNLEYVSTARQLADVILRALSRFSPGVHVLDEDVVRSLEEMDSRLEQTRCAIDRVAAALAMPRATLDAAKVAEALRQSRAGSNLESDQVIAKIRAARK